jgi:MFS family permease
MAAIALALQVADAFPEHREVRKTIVILSVGIFIGAASSALLAARYEITGNVDARFVLLFSLVVLLLVFALLAVLLTDAKKRESAGVVAWVLTGLFCLTGLAIGLGSLEREPSVSTDELLALARDAEGRGDFERAIDLSRRAKERVPDALRGEVEKRISELERRQIGR